MISNVIVLISVKFSVGVGLNSSYIMNVIMVVVIIVGMNYNVILFISVWIGSLLFCVCLIRWMICVSMVFVFIWVILKWNVLVVLIVLLIMFVLDCLVIGIGLLVIMFLFM